jgi:hypothetical protein
VLVLGEVRGDGVGSTQVLRVGLERQPGQVVHAVRGADGQGRPAVLPGAARPLVGVQDDEAGLRLEALAGEGPGGAQPGLPRPDDDDIRVHARTTHRPFGCFRAECRPAVVSGLR